MMIDNDVDDGNIGELVVMSDSLTSFCIVICRNRRMKTTKTFSQGSLYPAKS
jgi:hypothetical protein